MFGLKKKPTRELDHVCATALGDVVSTFGHPEKRKQEATIALMDQHENTHLLIGLRWKGDVCRVTVTSKDGEQASRWVEVPDCLHVRCIEVPADA